MKSQEIAYIVLSYILAATFISIFFFTYVASVEQDIIKTQVSSVVTEFINETNIFLTNNQKDEIGKIILNNLYMPNMDKEDEETDENNKKLLKKAILIFGVLISVGLLIIFILWYFYRFKIIEILIYSFIILFIIVITEISFVTLIVKNYRLIDKNYITYLILNNLKKYANS